MTNENDVLNDVLTMIDGPHGCIMGQMDAYIDGNTGYVTVRTIDGDIVTFTVKHKTNVCELAAIENGIDTLSR